MFMWILACDLFFSKWNALENLANQWDSNNSKQRALFIIKNNFSKNSFFFFFIFWFTIWIFFGGVLPLKPFICVSQNHSTISLWRNFTIKVNITQQLQLRMQTSLIQCVFVLTRALQRFLLLFALSVYKHNEFFCWFILLGNTVCVCVCSHLYTYSEQCLHYIQNETLEEPNTIFIYSIYK